jgi:hypothetical protein
MAGKAPNCFISELHFSQHRSGGITCSAKSDETFTSIDAIAATSIRKSLSALLHDWLTAQRAKLLTNDLKLSH